MLWCAYMLAAEAASRGLPRAFVDYDALLEDWRPQMAEAEAHLGEPLPALTAAAGRKIDAFLSTELRRNSGAGDLSALGEAGAMAASVLDWLRAAARGESRDTDALTRAADWLARQQALYGDLVSPVSADRAVARTALADAEGRATWLERTLEETNEIVATLEGRIQALYDTIRDMQGHMDSTIRDMQGHMDSLSQTCEDLRRHACSLETRLKASQEAVREAAERLEELVELG
jgi:chromosome segregation ATPase